MELFKGSSGGSSGGLLSNAGFGFGTGVVMGCKAEDDTFFCKFARVFNIIMMAIVLLVIASIIYGLVTKKTSLFGGAMKVLRTSLH